LDFGKGSHRVVIKSYLEYIKMETEALRKLLSAIYAHSGSLNYEIGQSICPPTMVHSGAGGVASATEIESFISALITEENLTELDNDNERALKDADEVLLGLSRELPNSIQDAVLDLSNTLEKVLDDMPAISSNYMRTLTELQKRPVLELTTKQMELLDSALPKSKDSVSKAPFNVRSIIDQYKSMLEASQALSMQDDKANSASLSIEEAASSLLSQLSNSL
jgi:uncharacterized phage infection (PIP) family protein YhgE